MKTAIDERHIESSFAAHGLLLGRSFGSKSGYVRSNRRCQFIPNAGVFDAGGQLWWGDLDLRFDRARLEKLAKILGRRLWVLNERCSITNSDSRPTASALAEALWHTGGKRCVGWRKHYRGSGLTRWQFCRIANFPRRLLQSRTRPEIALQWERRLARLVEFSTACSSAAGHASWGLWWIRPSSSGGKTPLSRLEYGRLTNGKFRLPIPKGAAVWPWAPTLIWTAVRRGFPWYS